MKEMIGIILYDKLLHFFTNYFIVTLVGVFNIPIAVAISLICSFGKELYDLFKYQGFDWYDIIADFAGLLIGLLICL